MNEKVYKSTLGLVICSFIIAFTMSVGMGANDVANSFGSIYGSRILTLMQIIIIASIFEILGSILIGLKVSGTIRNDIISLTFLDDSYAFSPDCWISNFSYATIMQNSNESIVYQKNYTNYCPELLQMTGSLSTLAGSSIWMLVANFLSLPVSTTHSIVGSTLGYGLVLLQGRGVHWNKIGGIVASWFLSPLASGLVTISVWLLLDRLILRSARPLARALKLMPLFYFLTVFIIGFSVLYKGSEVLHFHKVPLWGVFLLCLSLSVIVALCVWLFYVPYLRKNGATIELASKRFTTAASSSLSQPEITTKKLEEDSAPSHHQQSLHSQTSSLPPPTVSMAHCPLTNGPILTNVLDDFSRGLSAPSPLPDSQIENTSETTAKHDPPSAVNTTSVFKGLQIIMACYGSFAHGGNDVSNSVAPLMTTWLVFKGEPLTTMAAPPVWILAYGGIGMVIGLALWGKRVLTTVGVGITEITPSSGFAIEFGSVITVITLTRMGLPISTTHCKIGSVVALGWVKNGFNSVSPRVLISIALSWFVTVPVSGLFSAAIFSTVRAIIFRDSWPEQARRPFF